MIVLAGLGGFFGVLLAVLSKVFAVEVDERFTKVLEMLPGYNCGACGFPGCQGLAEQIVAGKADAIKCKPGKQEMRDQIKAYLEAVSKDIKSEK
ncbi:MAG: (Fe-S)-binding protein [Bacilli bacterium]|nr:(Fe-S)-binding protein [Bacilli bacterium]